MDFEPRIYQQTIFAQAAKLNTLVVLPTGLGKTHIAMMLAQQRVKLYPKEKVLMLAPTKPLVDQHAKTFADHLPDAQTLSTVLNGKIKPEKRAEEFANATYIFSTPQTIENDLLAKRISLEDVSLLVIDEAHRATGDYAYVYIAKQYRRQANHERILSLTASPGADKATIQEIIDNVAAEHIEVKTQEDPDVKPYVQEFDIKHVEVELPQPLKNIKTLLERMMMRKLTEVKRNGHIPHVKVNKTQLLGATRQLQAEIKSGQPDKEVWRSISVLAEVLKAQHALELLETQGVDALITYMEGLQKQAERGQSKAVKNLVSDTDFKRALTDTRVLSQKGLEHPKFIKLLSIVKVELAKNPDAKIIVFNQYRDMAQKIVQSLKGKASLFVGQQKKGETGLTQKEQKAMLQAFRDGKFPILVATAVGEEGLDIPSVDLVIFYEPVPSAIRTIQRRGRTGRQDTGRVIMLIAKGTRDVGYRWAAHHKEARMYRVLKTISGTVTPAKPKSQKALDEFTAQPEITIQADSREKGSGVLKELQNIGVDLELKQLPVGDYLLSKRVCVEFKTAEDFVDSLLDGRLLGQMQNLTTYQRPIVIVQGADWYAKRNVHPNAIRGAMSAIAVSYGVPILVTQNDADTAELLKTIARREQEGGIEKGEFVATRSGSPRDVVLNIVAQLPGVGPVLAPKLMKRFGSLKALINAEVDELRQVDGIGKRKAEELVETFEKQL